MTPVADILSRLDAEKGSETVREALVRHGADALETMLATLPSLRSWQARNAVVYTAIKFARQSRVSLEIGRLGLQDKSKRVRQTACALAAFSLNREMLCPLSECAKTSDPETAEDARAAIHAIEKNNHNLFVDRLGTGRVLWHVWGTDMVDPSGTF